MATRPCFPLSTYLTGLGTATLLATTSNAAVIEMDISSISGINGGFSPGTFGNVSISSLTNGVVGGDFFVSNTDVEIGIASGSNDTTIVSIATNTSNPFDKTNAKPFQAGETIDQSSFWATAPGHTLFYYETESTYTAPSWGPGNYLGFYVTTATGGANLGWLEVTWDDNTREFQILSGAFETGQNVSIVAGAIPEPSSLALLAAGAAGVAVLRRRRKMAA